jgi:hypothetical protein
MVVDNGKKFEGQVLAKLESLGDKIDETKHDLNGRIDTLFDLLEKRDASCRQTHEVLNGRVLKLEVNGAVTSDRASFAKHLWERIGLLVAGALIGIFVWLIESQPWRAQ